MIGRSDQTDKRGDAALLLAVACDWHVFPIWGVADGKCDCGDARCDSAGKHPVAKLVPNGFKQATTSAPLIQHWWNEYPNANIGVRTGNGSEIFVVDLDRANGIDGLQQFVEISPDGFGYDSFDETPKAITGSGGRHIVFKLADDTDVRNRCKLRGLNIDCRGNGGYFVVPPSQNASGAYRWDISPLDFEPSDAPDWILGLVTESGGIQKNSDIGDGLSFSCSHDLESHPGSSEGNRNRTLCQLVGTHLVTNGLNNDLIPLAVAWGERCTPAYPAKSVRKTVMGLAEKHVQQQPTKITPTAIMVSYDKIDPQEVEWLWQDHIAIGKLTIVSGDPGLGKTFLLLDITARVSRGMDFPDGAKCRRGKVIFLTAEDGAADTIRPRLDAMDASVENVFHFEGIRSNSDVVDFFELDKHLIPLQEAISEMDNVRLLVIDPITAFMGNTDSHNNADVRRVLAPLAKLAEEESIAVVGISHLTKGSAQSKAIYRTMGSLAFVAAARAAWGVVKDPEDDDRRLFLPIKNNLADVQGLAYRLDDGRVEWEAGEVTVSIDNLSESTLDDGPKDEAKAWLLGQLEQGPVAAKAIQKAAKDDSIGLTTLKRAKKELGVASKRIDGAWKWIPPPQLKIGGEKVSSEVFGF
jgi:archaellum biogenesis ATPase FlaH